LKKIKKSFPMGGRFVGQIGSCGFVTSRLCVKKGLYFSIVIRIGSGRAARTEQRDAEHHVNLALRKHDFITKGFRKSLWGGANRYGTFMTFSRFNK
jgi:hypothetical protein